MSKDTISVRDFSDLLDRLGPALGQWPGELRSQAETLLSRSEEAVSLLAEALALAETIRAAQPKAPAGLAERIIIAAGASKPKN